MTSAIIKREALGIDESINNGIKKLAKLSRQSKTPVKAPLNLNYRGVKTQ